MSRTVWKSCWIGTQSSLATCKEKSSSKLTDPSCSSNVQWEHDIQQERTMTIPKISNAFVVFPNGVLRGSVFDEKKMPGCELLFDFVDENGRQVWVAASRVFSTESEAQLRWQRLFGQEKT